MSAKSLIAVSSVALTAAAALLIHSKIRTAKNIDRSSGADRSPSPISKSPDNYKDVVFSFISGISNAVKVDAIIRYSADYFDCSIISENTPVFTNAPEVVILYGSEVSVQLENVDIFARGTLDNVIEELRERYSGLDPVSYGSHKAFRYVDGDCMMIVIPIEGANDCYFQAALMKEPKADFELSDIYKQPDIINIISSLEFKISEL